MRNYRRPNTVNVRVYRIGSLYQVISLTLAVVTTTILRTAAAQTTRPADFAKEGAWTAERVCLALEWRESKLRNSSFSYEEKCWLFKSGNAELYQDTKADVRCKGSTTWYKFTESYPTIPELDFSNAIQAWDGSQCIILNEHLENGVRKFRGGLMDRPPEFLVRNPTYNALGLSWGRKVDTSMAKLLLNALQIKGTTSSLDDESMNGEHVLKLTVTPGPGPLPPSQFEETLLPDKDFVCIDSVERTHNRPDATSGDYLNHIHAEDIAQLDGFWMPRKLKDRITFGLSDAQYDIELTSFSSKAPSDDDMKVDFPLGTKVMDSINHEYYVVMEDGKKQYLPFYDEAAGKIMRPTTQGSESIDAKLVPAPGD